MTHPAVGHDDDTRTARGAHASTGRRRRRGTTPPGSKPPSVRNRSARTRMQADGTTNTSRDRIVLLLVDLVGLGDRVDLAEPVEPESDVLEQRRPVPVDELRTDDAGVRPVELLDEETYGARDRARCRRDRAGRTRCRPRRAGAPRWPAGRSPDCLPRAMDERRPGLRDGCVRRTSAELVVGGVGEHEQEAKVGVVLRGEGSDRLVEPGAGVVHDDDRDHRRGERLVGFHERARLSVDRRRPDSAAQGPPPTVSSSVIRRHVQSVSTALAKGSSSPYAVAVPDLSIAILSERTIAHSIDLPSFDLPSFDLSKFELPNDRPAPTCRSATWRRRPARRSAARRKHP